MIIALSAKKRHGKDTVADYICEHHGFKKYALASAFKPLIAKYLHQYVTSDMVEGINYDREQLIDIPGKDVVYAFKSIISELGYYASNFVIDWEPIESKDQWSVRQLMQTIGTDIGCNQVDRLIWMHPFINRMQWGEDLVVSDCRQDHEMDIMRDVGAKVIHVINPLIKNTDTHITEAGLEIDPFDIIIYNNFDPTWNESRRADSLKKLYLRIEAVLDELKI